MDNESPDRPSSQQADTRTQRRDAAAFVSGGGNEAITRHGAGLYGLLVDSVTDYAIFALDPTGRILSWNAGARRIKGYTADEVIGKHFSIFIPAEDVAAGKAEMELEVAAREGRFEDEDWRIRKDGSKFWANVVITALRDETGALVGFAKVTRDLTDRREAEEALRTSEERFRLIVTSVKDYAIFMLDPTGHVASWNEGAQRIKGYTADDIIGKHFSVFYPPEEVSKTEWELDVAVRDGRFEDEGFRVRKDGTKFWANVIITPLRNVKGELIGFAKVTRDLTDWKIAEERALDDARRLAAAEAANKAKSEFLTMMSHELRTPLNAIAGYAQLIELGVVGDVTPEQRAYLSRIQSSQQHLLGVINDLLNYSRIEAGQVTYHVEPFDMHAVLEKAQQMLTPQAASRQIRMTHGPCPDTLIAFGDRAKVEQVLLNLLSNAVKFTPPGGEILAQCVRDGDSAIVNVDDTGPGIPEERREDVFEPFVQLGRTLTQAQEGTGLGLAISRDLARAMDGDLSVSTAPIGGARFTLRLPVADASPGNAKSTSDSR